jgi:hypothetical protein
MKKNIGLLPGIIAFAAIIGLFMTGCSDGQSCKDQYKCHAGYWGCNDSSCGAKKNDPWIGCSCD